MRILVVEDEPRLSDTLRDILESQQYLVDIALDGVSGLDDALSGIYDAMILDVMLPGLDGMQVARELRSNHSDLPILMLTARADLTDRIHGLDCGADYYLTKPFATQELLACLRALLRRKSEVQPQTLSCGDITLDLLSCVLSSHQESLRLSAKEFEIMRMLMTACPGVVSKETLLLKAWGYDTEAEDNHVEVYISFLRKKLRHLGSCMEIHTLRRIGYFLEGAQ